MLRLLFLLGTLDPGPETEALASLSTDTTRPQRLVAYFCLPTPRPLRPRPVLLRSVPSSHTPRPARPANRFPLRPPPRSVSSPAPGGSALCPPLPVPAPPRPSPTP